MFGVRLRAITTFFVLMGVGIELEMDGKKNEWK